MSLVTLEFLSEQLELAEKLRLGKDSMLEPQDLPGRYFARRRNAGNRPQTGSNHHWASGEHGRVRSNSPFHSVAFVDRVETGRRSWSRRWRWSLNCAGIQSNVKTA